MKLSRKELGTICTALSLARTKFLEAPDLGSTVLALTNQQCASEMEISPTSYAILKSSG